jgi:hypothetical protein
VTGIGLQNLPVEKFRLVQAAGLMMSQGDGEHLLNAWRWFRPHELGFQAHRNRMTGIGQQPFEQRAGHQRGEHGHDHQHREYLLRNQS